MIDSRDLDNRFTYHAPKEGQPEVYEAIRAAGRQLAELVNEKVPDGREKSLAVTHIEDAVMWANAALARHG